MISMKNCRTNFGASTRNYEFAFRLPRLRLVARGTEKTSSAAYLEISNPHNIVFLSVATVRELQIKIALDKLSIKNGLKVAVEDEQQRNGFQILPVELSHALYLTNLPPHHKDPFDRLLIAQANIENLFLVSGDENFAKYQVNLLW